MKWKTTDPFQIYHFCQNSWRNLFVNNLRAQHGDCTLHILNNILTAHDDDKFAALLLLDLSTAFDTIDHKILLSRLWHEFSICSTAQNWFQSYLSDRRQYVLIQGQKLTEKSLDFGVPQGSVLGPVLCILYTTSLTALKTLYSSWNVCRWYTS